MALIDRLSRRIHRAYHGLVTPDLRPVDLGILLALAYQQLVEQLRASLAEQGFDDLGRWDGYVFRQLAVQPITVSVLAGRLDITKQGAAQIVEDMQRRGYLQRRPDPSDGRAQLLVLSERGAAALAAARRFHQRYERRLGREHGRNAVLAARAVLTAMAGCTGDSADPLLRTTYL